MQHVFTLIMGSLMLLSTVTGDGFIPSSNSGCKGFAVEPRMTSVSEISPMQDLVGAEVSRKEDIQALLNNQFDHIDGSIQDSDKKSGRSYQLIRIQEETRKGECISEHHRYQELIHGVPIYAADIVLSTKGCIASSSDGKMTVKTISGYTFLGVDVEGGYVATYNEEDAKIAIVDLLQTEMKRVVPVEFGNITLEVRSTTEGDFLVYTLETISASRIVDISVNANNLSQIVARCDRSE